MQILDRYFGESVPWGKICEWAVAALLVLAILWRGGKSVDMTWLLTGVAAFVTLVSHTKNRQTGEKEIPLFLWGAVIGFIVLTALSFVTSVAGNYGFDEVLRTGALGLILLWAIRTASGERYDEGFAIALVRILSILVVVACAIGILVYMFQPVNRFVGTFFDYRFHTDYWPNAWAQFLLLVWPLVLYWVLRDHGENTKTSRTRIEFLLRTGICGIVIGCLFLSYSRGATLAFFAQLGIWASIVFKKTHSQFPVRQITPVAVALVGMTFLTMISVNTLRSQWYEVQEVGEKITLQAAEGSSSVSERFQFWGQAINLAAKKPLLGWGPYSFRFVQPSLQTGVLTTSDHPHNVLLKLLMERGALTLIVFAFVVGLVLYRATVLLLSDRTEVGTARFSLRILIYLGLCGVVLHNMIDFNLQFVGIALPFWLLLGVLMTHLDIGSLRNVPKNIARGTELLIATTLLILACYEGVYLVITSMGRHAEANKDPFVAMEWYEKADGEIFTRDLHLSRAKILFDEGKLIEADAAVDTYLKSNSEDYRAWKRKADIARHRGNLQDAVTYYEIAFERGRFNDIGILNGLMDTYVALGDKETLDAQLPMTEGLLNQYADAIQVNAHYIALSPNVEQFIVACNTLARLYPDKAPKYQVMAAKADHHAQIERERIQSRPPGFLW